MVMDQIVSPLESHTTKKLHPAIITTLGLAQKKMNHYYSLTNSSSVYQTAMGMLPGWLNYSN
jgi:hypothetical protein